MTPPWSTSATARASSPPPTSSPIVDDPFTFGRIAATNAISDIYAMGGKPIVAIAILGWPINTLAPGGPAGDRRWRQGVTRRVFLLAGGHSIDAPEPIFGLAVTGIAATRRHQAE